MSSGPQQLMNDFEQVKKLLEIYPDIKIIKTAGDPPDQYDIEYTIKGYKTNPDGTTSPDNNHQVRISLPFGYPHFPPTAKPLTPIFHPDIDPDAIRIADFWQKNHSLSDLIIHIGQMICGKHYTKDEPFNQNAFEWFEERKSWLPFDILEPREEDSSEEEAQTPTLGAEKKQSFAPATDLDILKDDIDFPFYDDEGADEQGEAFSFTIDEDSATGEQTDLEGDEISLDFGDDGPAEAFNLLEREEDDDLFSLDMDEPDDGLSFDLTEEAEKTGPEEETSPVADLFALEIEPAGELNDEAPPLEFDSGDITSAFEEDAEHPAVSLDDLEGFDADALDFGFEEDLIDIGGEASADLSGLEEETESAVEETTAGADETADDEEKILSALSLDADHSSSNRPKDQSQAIRSLIDQKQIFSAKKTLAGLPDPDALADDRKELELTIASAVSEAEDLFKKADKLEHKGELEKAGILLDLVANIATDFPGLDFARNRIRESMMSGGKKKPDAEPDGEKPEGARTGETDASTSKTGKKKTKPPAKLGFKIPARLIVMMLVVAFLGAAGAGGWYVYNNDLKSVQLANTTFQRAQKLVDSKEFQDGQKALDTAKATLEQVLFFQGAEKEAILLKIAGLASADMFKEGLKGRVLYGDQFVSVETAKAIDKFNSQKGYAEQMLQAGKVDQAITAYEKALPYAEKAEFDDETKSITRRIMELRLDTAMTRAKQFETDQNWPNAETEYRSALELSKQISPQEVQNDIANRLATASYRYGLHEGLKAFNNSEWQKSIDAFQSIKNTLEVNPQIVPETEITEVNKLLIQSRLYSGLTTARKAYEDKEWKRALEIYDDAVLLLKTNASLLGQETMDNVKKIEKTILTTHVAREQVQIAIAKAEKTLDKTIEHYEAIVSLIENSAFKADETLGKILEDARTKTVEIKNQLLVSNREKWLTDNYEKIFRENYPSAESSELLNPKVRFIKREANIMIFNISCTERKQGRTFRLELNYQQDMDKDAWSLYSGKIEEE